MLVLAPLWLIAVTTSMAMAMGLVFGYCIGWIRSEEDE